MRTVRLTENSAIKVNHKWLIPSIRGERLAIDIRATYKVHGIHYSTSDMIDC